MDIEETAGAETRVAVCLDGPDGPSFALGLARIICNSSRGY